MRMELLITNQSSATSVIQLNQYSEESDNNTYCSPALKITLLALGIIIGLGALFILQLQLALMVSSISIGLPVLLVTKRSWRDWQPVFTFFTPSTSTTFSATPITTSHRRYTPPPPPGVNHHFGSGHSGNPYAYVPASPSPSYYPPSTIQITPVVNVEGNRAFGSRGSGNDTSRSQNPVVTVPGTQTRFGSRQSSSNSFP